MRARVCVRALSRLHVRAPVCVCACVRRRLRAASQTAKHTTQAARGVFNVANDPPKCCVRVWVLSRVHPIVTATEPP